MGVGWGGRAWEEWTLGASERKVTLRPSGQPSCFTDVDTEAPTAGRGCSRAGAQDPGSCLWGKGATWECGAGLFLA